MLSIRNGKFSAFLTTVLILIHSELLHVFGTVEVVSTLDKSPSDASSTQSANLSNSSSSPREQDSSSTSHADSLPPPLYFGTLNSGIQAYSFQNASVTRIANSTDFLHGTAYDSLKNKIYYSQQGIIYRGNTDGSEVETVYENLTQLVLYGSIQGLAFDWITGNLFGTTRWGTVFVCGDNNSNGGSFRCTNLLSRQGVFHGIAVNPLQGAVYWTGMFWTAGIGNSIWRAEMDGSNTTVIIPGRDESWGCIAIDLNHSRLYWTGVMPFIVKSSDLEGGDIQTIAKIPMSMKLLPFGIALYKERIYWGNFNTGVIQSSTKTGEDVSTVYNSTSDIIYHLAFVPPADLPVRSRRNDCEDEKCSGICVLTRNRSRCLLREFEYDEKEDPWQL